MTVSDGDGEAGVLRDGRLDGDVPEVFKLLLEEI